MLGAMLTRGFWIGQSHVLEVYDMNIFNHDLASFSTFKFLPNDTSIKIDAMGERWEMVFSQINRISVWRFQNDEGGWYCLDLFTGDRHDSFEMEQFEGVKWTHTQTLWLSTLQEVIEFVAVVAELDIDESV